MTLDYNHRPSFADKVNDAVDAALTAENATRTPRDYLGGSRLGHACERQPFLGARQFMALSLRMYADNFTHHAEWIADIFATY